MAALMESTNSGSGASGGSGMDASSAGAMGGGIGAIGGLIGYSAGGSARRNARDKLSEAMGEIMSLGLPPDLSVPLVLEKYRQAGELTPELESAIMAGATQMENVKADAEAVTAQKDALKLISQRGRVGLTPEDRLEMSRIQQETAKSAEAKRQQILQNMAARGQAGSGQELAAQMMASQDAAQRQNEAALQTGAAASKNALSAIAQQGNLGTTIRNSSFDEGARIATAQDARKNFDIANQRDVQQRNVTGKNNAQEFNLRNAQDISNRNTSQQNEEAKRQADAKRQFWVDQSTRAKMRSGALTTGAGYDNDAAAGTQKAWSDGAQAVGSAATAIAMSDKNAKTNIKSSETDFLDDIKPYEYEYKDKKHGEGKQIGVMAQDIEKSLPQMIVDTDEGKQVDYNKAGGPILAALASINARVRKLEK